MATRTQQPNQVIRRPRPIREAIGKTAQAGADIVSTLSVGVSAIKEVGLMFHDSAVQMRHSNQLEVKLEYIEDVAEFDSVVVQLGITEAQLSNATTKLGF